MKDVERVSPQSLEIALIERFQKTIREIHSTVSSSDDICEEDDGEPNESTITVHPDGTGVHYSDRKCPAHNSEEFYEFRQSKTEEIIAYQFTVYERSPDNTIDIARIGGGKIVVKGGMLIQSINPQLIQSALQRLSKIGEEMKASINTGSIATPLNPAALH